ncbi:3893_t:CDS:2 [Ambispora leptoticha]|uniref:3893_t:CDS:1 n=1 Tax=Ambispora leptoticha TaxID=144679 RepID=A0A9N9EZT5_9GLOM|nr:3893_t:CDS:2 [Ambispora leptoticha]
MSLEYRSIYQFILNKKSLGTKTFYSPLLSAPSNIHWQLQFNLDNTKEIEYCSIRIHAIPNKHEDQNQNTVWLSRKNLKQKLFLKDQYNNYLTSGIVDRNYGHGKLNWGYLKFYEWELLPETFIIGVEFNTSVSEEILVTGFLDHKKNPELKNAWLSDLNNPNTSDIRFIVGDQEFYASSKILSTQSKYFQALLSAWMEMKDLYEEKFMKNKRVFDYEIMDTDPTLFLQMLKYLYTGDVIYESSDFLKNALDLYGIADKYLLDELREQTAEHIVSSMTVENAAEILFGSAYKWPELKKVIKKFVVKNFTKISDTSCYEIIIKNRNNYPSFHEINSEILLSLHQKDIFD